MFLDAQFWVAVAFVMFLAVLGYFGVHRNLIAAIDRRRSSISSELEEAQRLKSEAGAVLEGVKHRRHEVEGTAVAIVGDARVQAERIEADAKVEVEELMGRLTKNAEARIALAESQATAEIRAMVADVAVAAAGELLTARLDGNRADQMLTRDIADLERRFRSAVS